MKVVWSLLALERVESIAQYIAEDRPSAALNWVDGLFSCVDGLGEFPESGRVVPEVRLRAEAANKPVKGDTASGAH